MDQSLPVENTATNNSRTKAWETLISDRLLDLYANGKYEFTNTVATRNEAVNQPFQLLGVCKGVDGT